MIETLSRIVLHILREYAAKPDILQYRSAGLYHPISTEEFGRRLRALALGLNGLGCGPGRKLIILSENRPEWILADLANLALGGVTVPVYPTIVPAQIKYIIEDSEASVILCSTPALRGKIEALRAELPGVAHYLTMESEAPSGFLTLAEIMRRGEQDGGENSKRFEDLALAVRPEDLASIIYTSGTTGMPKGVMLSHANFMSNILSLCQVVPFRSTDTALSFLPLSHVLERTATFLFLHSGASIAYAESIETVGENLTEVRPTIMISVPRLFEKMYARVMDMVLKASPPRKGLFFWALSVGKRYAAKEIARQPVPRLLRLQRGLAARLVFSKIVARTGGRVRFMVCGGAPLAADIAEFFYAMGLIILPGYGLTETSPVLTANTLDDYRFGTVGRAIPGVELRIAPDGEILARGPSVMMGYYGKEAETREAMVEGWLHTGDIGRLDPDGFLVITDRKKDLIITAGGKNVAPQPIESILSLNPYVGSVVVVGERKKFISALIVPDFERLEAYARENGIAFRDRAELCRREDIASFMLAEVNRSTPDLAPYERIKKIVLLDRDFDIASGEVTPTLKVRRGIVEEKYKDLIDALYAE